MKLTGFSIKIKVRGIFDVSELGNSKRNSSGLTLIAMNFEHCHIQKVAARSLIPGRIVDFGSLVFIVRRKPENQ